MTLTWAITCSSAVLFALSVIGIFSSHRNHSRAADGHRTGAAGRPNMNFVAFSHFLGDMHGQVFVFFI